MSQPNQNKSSYEKVYSSRKVFLRYPADHVIRFHHQYLKTHQPTGRVLDFGCGSGNNARLFLDKGYEVVGTDITDAVIPLCAENGLHDVTILDPESDSLPFDDDSFDVVVSNQVLYYLASKDRIQAVCKEFSRILKPGGIVYFTMMGTRSNYIVQGHAKPVSGDIYEIHVKSGRMAGIHEIVYIVKDEDHLTDLFSEFDTVTVGYFRMAQFDLESTFHWIYCGRTQ